MYSVFNFWINVKESYGGDIKFCGPIICLIVSYDDLQWLVPIRINLSKTSWQFGSSMRNFLISSISVTPPGVCWVLTSPRVSVSSSLLLLSSPHLWVSPLSSAPLGGLGPRPGYLLLALRSQLVTALPTRVIREQEAGPRENNTSKDDIYRKSFIEFCKNHQYWKLKEKSCFPFNPIQMSLSQLGHNR